MNVAITGASGFIGHELVTRLLSHSERVPYIGRLIAFTTSASGEQSLKRLFPEVEVRQLWKCLDTNSFLDIDVLLHAGWSTVPNTSQHDPFRDIRENIDPGLRILNAISGGNLKRFIFLSSGGTVYGKRNVIATESTPVRPMHFHGVAKLMFERYLEIYSQRGGFEYLVLRPGNVYGNLLALSKPQGVIEHWMDALRHDRPLEVWGSLEVVRDYLYIKDLVDVLVSSIHRPLSQEIMNVGTGTGTDLHGLSTCMSAITGLELRMKHIPVGPALVPYNVLDPSRVQASFGPISWTPLSKGLEILWKAMLDGGAV